MSASAVFILDVKGKRDPAMLPKLVSNSWPQAILLPWSS
ncbi:AP1M2 isoform 3 [Pan troglodytes]|uniref:AP1M2 isoform 4 n=2 Tax=Hominidae TaxID=9604 RepID=A0A2J8S0X1_PONAB|nr:AP1M2 isoform 3 [Pan troglodytes]PNJ14427.1 AP1M2 isoform 4 [Pongo abelii]